MTFIKPGTRTPCTEPTANPADWDTLSLNPGRGESSLDRMKQQLTTAHELCGQCPLLKECATWALSQPVDWSSVVLAGIPLYDPTSRANLVSIKALARIARGESLESAHERILEAHTVKVEQLSAIQRGAAAARSAAARGRRTRGATQPGRGAMGADRGAA